jgi:hypothetical protein
MMTQKSGGACALRKMKGGSNTISNAMSHVSMMTQKSGGKCSLFRGGNSAAHAQNNVMNARNSMQGGNEEMRALLGGTRKVNKK